jgi:hypothetical protein
VQHKNKNLSSQNVRHEEKRQPRRKQDDENCPQSVSDEDRIGLAAKEEVLLAKLSKRRRLF